MEFQQRIVNNFGSELSGAELYHLRLDIFPNWENSLPTAKLQTVRHTFLSTNFRLTFQGGLVV